MSIIQENDEISSNRVIGKTSKGKEVALMRDKRTGLFNICFKSGGEIPDELKGLWNFQNGIDAIKTYLAKKVEDKKE